MLKWVSPVKRVWFMVDLRYDFNILIPLNDLSAVAVVTDDVQSMTSSVWRLGNTYLSQISKASTTLAGGAFNFTPLILPDFKLSLYLYIWTRKEVVI